MPVSVAQTCRQQHQTSEHQQVDDDHPGGVCDAGLELLGQRRQGQRNRQAGELDQHVGRRQTDQDFPSAPGSQQRPDHSKQAQDVVTSLAWPSENDGWQARVTCLGSQYTIP